MAFGTGRTPRADRRTRRNWGKMTKDSGIVDGDAIQIGADGRITLKIATGEPLTQDSNGLALATDATLTETSSTLGIDQDEEYSRILYYS